MSYRDLVDDLRQQLSQADGKYDNLQQELEQTLASVSTLQERVHELYKDGKDAEMAKQELQVELKRLREQRTKDKSTSVDQAVMINQLKRDNETEQDRLRRNARHAVLECMALKRKFAARSPSAVAKSKQKIHGKSKVSLAVSSNVKLPQPDQKIRRKKKRNSDSHDQINQNLVTETTNNMWDRMMSGSPTFSKYNKQLNDAQKRHKKNMIKEQIAANKVAAAGQSNSNSSSNSNDNGSNNKSKR